jgi:hypothetical protein
MHAVQIVAYARSGFFPKTPEEPKFLWCFYEVLQLALKTCCWARRYQCVTDYDFYS